MDDRAREAALSDVHTDREHFGRDVSPWSMQTVPSQRDGHWTLEELFASGRIDADATVQHLAELGVARRRRALDFGCGVGRVTRALAAHYEQVVGVDGSPTMIEQARTLDERTGRVEFVQNAEPHLRRFGDQTFDLVYSKLTLQHMPPQLSARYLSELARLVSYGGALVVQVPSSYLGRDRLPDGAYRAEISHADVSSRVESGASVLVHATVRNASAHAWRASAARLAVGARWRDATGEPLALDEGRAMLGADIDPGESRSVDFSITAPVGLGAYQLVVDVVHEGVTWFADQDGRPMTLAVNVVARPVNQRVRGRLQRMRRGSDPEPTEVVEIQTYGLPIVEVTQRIETAGLRLARTDRDNAAPGWRSATYYAIR